MQHLVLDRDVRDWVLVPLTLCIALMMLMRQYATTLMATPPAAAKATTAEARERGVLARAALLRGNGEWISSAGLAQRKAYLAAKPSGVLCSKPTSKSAHEAMMTNPEAVTGMLKQSLSGIVPQVAMGAFVSFFFSGFILGRVPFPLSPSFRLMLQRGVDLPSLDVTYFTSLSFYILLLFGLRGAFMLAFREGGVIDEAAMQRMSMGMGGGNAAAAPDPAKAFEAEQAAVAALAWDAPRLDGAESAACEALKKFLAAPSPSSRRSVERES